MAGINKAEDGGRTDTGIGFADALRLIFPPALARYVVFHGWIRPKTLYDRSSVTFDLRQCALPNSCRARWASGDGGYGRL